MKKTEIMQMWERHANEKENADRALTYSKQIGVYQIEAHPVEGGMPQVVVTPDVAVGSVPEEVLRETLELKAAIRAWWNDNAEWPDDGRRRR